MSTPGKSTVIYSFYYQPKNLLSAGKEYVPVWVGKNNKSGVQGFTGDDTGENISEKNKYFSELTGIYWVWKNTYSDIVGTCHYRRYFYAGKEPFQYRLKRWLYHPVFLWRKRYGLIYTKNYDFWKTRLLSEEQIRELLGTCDAIMPVRRILRKSVREHYINHHNPADLELLKKILNNHFPEYLDTFEKVLNGNRLFANNMFIMPWETFDRMMSWLFFVLFRFEEETDLEHYKGYQERIFGFLSERLITLWVTHNKINYTELPLIYFKSMKQNRNYLW